MAILKWSWTPRRVCPQEQRRVGRRKGEGSESDWAAAPHCNSDARNQQAGPCGTTIQARAQSAGAFVEGKKRKKKGWATTTRNYNLCLSCEPAESQLAADFTHL